MSDDLQLFDPAGNTSVPASRTVLTPSADQWAVREFDGTPVLEATLPDGRRLEVAGLVSPEHVRKLNTSTAYFPNHGYGKGRGNPVKLFVSREGAKRRADTRVRPDTELDFVARLVQDGLPRYDQHQIGRAS